MIFKDIHIYAHPRSGSNYFAGLINTNFVKRDNFREIYGGHILPGEIVRNNPSIAFLYIKRDFDSVLNSIFKMKERFGLFVTSIEELQNSIYKDVYNPRLKSYIKVDNKDKSSIETKVSRFFSNIEMKPKEYHNYHIEQWLENEKYENFYCVDYDDLIHNFDQTMGDIAKFLGLEITNFSNITEKIGYTPPNKGKYYLIMNLYNNYILRPGIFFYRKYLKKR